MTTPLGTFTARPGRSRAPAPPTGRRTGRSVPARPRTGVPPFGFRVEGPDDWATVRVAGATGPEVQRALEAQLGWTDLDADDRATADLVLRQLSATAVRSGVAATMVRVGRDGPDGDLFAGSLSFGWMDAAPVDADLTLVRRVVGWTTPQRRLDTPTGPAVLVAAPAPVARGMRPLFPDDTAQTTQVFLPVPGTSWIAVVSCVVGRERWAGLASTLAARGAQTLRVLQPSATPGHPPRNGAPT